MEGAPSTPRPSTTPATSSSQTSLDSLREDTDVDWRPRVAQWPAIGETMAKIIQATLVGQVKPKPALDDAQTQVERIMRGG